MILYGTAKVGIVGLTAHPTRVLAPHVHVNALFLLSMAGWESGALQRQWRERHKTDRAQFRIFGGDSSPSRESLADAVGKTARRYAQEYLHPKGECYGGSPTLTEVSVWWISDRVKAAGPPTQEAERRRLIQAILETSRALLARVQEGEPKDGE